MPLSPLQRLLVRSRMVHSSNDDDEVKSEGESDQEKQHSDRPLSRRHSTKIQRKPAWNAWFTPPARRITNPLQRREDDSPELLNEKKKQPHYFRQRRNPNVATFLLRLHQHLEAYCKHLSDPTVENAVAAASLLDAGVAVIASTNSPRSSPSGRNLSPTLSSFFSASLNKSTQPTAAMAIQLEWEALVAPLLLLAGAEALYGQLEHLTADTASDAARRRGRPSDLRVLYRTICKDLAKVQEELCDPVLKDPPFGERRESVMEAARTVKLTLEGLKLLTNLRCDLVEWQIELFSGNSNQEEKEKDSRFSVLAKKCLKWLPDISTPESSRYILDTLSAEIFTWNSLLETMDNLEKCRFMETILAAKKTKGHVNVSSTTTLQSWFRHSLEQVISIMPLYFDAISTLASPLYGFDCANLATSNQSGAWGVLHDYESIVLDFLRRQEKHGGTAMAISIVVDAVRTSNEHFERGVILDRSETKDEEPLEDTERARREWKAVYMRSTLHSVLSSTPLSRSPSTASSGLFRLSTSSFRASSSKREMSDDSGTVRASPKHPRKTRTLEGLKAANSMHVMEYAPERGTYAWPHTEWPRLVELISDSTSMKPTSPTEKIATTDAHVTRGKAVTYRNKETLGSIESSPLTPAQSPSTGWMSTWASPTSRSPAPPPVEPPPSPPTFRSKTSDSIFHTIRLNDFMWLVVIVKEEEEGKWHLRRARGSTDEEIRSFLNSMASKIRLSCLFGAESIANARVKVPQDDEANVLPGHDLLTLFKGSEHLDEANAKHFLKSLKESFGLRPQTPMTHNPYRGLFRSNSDKKRSNRSPRRGRLRKRRAYTHEESAIAFFLGEDLIRSRKG